MKKSGASSSPGPGLGPRIKSILKPRSTSDSKFPTKAAPDPRDDYSERSKKRVEISSVRHTLAIVGGKRKSRRRYRSTPLPRVAMITAPSKPKAQSHQKAKPAKDKAPADVGNKTKVPPPSPKSKSPSATPPQAVKAHPVSSASTSKLQTKSSFSVSSGKRAKKKNTSKSTSDVTAAAKYDPPPPPHNLKKENSGKEYIKELATINELLKSVTEMGTGNSESKEPQILSGLVRPFSTSELAQLITSVEKVATIHQNPEALLPLVESSMPPMTHVPFHAESKDKDHALASNSDEGSTKKLKRKKRRSRKSLRSKSKSKNGELTATPSRQIPAKGSTDKNLASKKTLKSNVKNWKNKTSMEQVGSKKQKRENDLEQDLSELDLVKSALLNKRFFEESMALERLRAAEEPSPNEDPGSKKKRKGQPQKEKRSKAPVPIKQLPTSTETPKLKT